MTTPRETEPTEPEQSLRERIKLAIQTAQDSEGQLLYAIPPGVAGMYADAVMRVVGGKPYPYDDVSPSVVEVEASLPNILPNIVTSLEELDALPIGSVVMDVRHWVAAKFEIWESDDDDDLGRPAWWLTGHDGEWPAAAIMLPATVLSAAGAPNAEVSSVEVEAGAKALAEHGFDPMESKNLGYYRMEVTCDCGEVLWWGGHEGDPHYHEVWRGHVARAVLVAAKESRRGEPE